MQEGVCKQHGLTFRLGFVFKLSPANLEKEESCAPGQGQDRLNLAKFNRYIKPAAQADALYKKLT